MGGQHGENIYECIKIMQSNRKKRAGSTSLGFRMQLTVKFDRYSHYARISHLRLYRC